MGSPNATNSGLIEYHVESVIHHGWAIYMASLTEFTKLFPGVSTARVGKWFTELSQQKPRIGLAWTRGSATFPEMIVMLESETPSNEPLGQRTYVRTVDNREIQQELLQQTVSIEVRARTPEATIAAARVVRAVINLATEAFVEAGYVVISYLGTDALTPEQMMMAEQYGLAGISLRRVRYSFTGMVDTPETEAPPEGINWFVLQDDLTTLAGDPGGVVPYDG